MIKYFYVSTLSGLLTLAAQASEPTILTKLPDFIIKDLIMSKLKNDDLFNFGLASKQTFKLAKAKFIENQREDFKKNLQVQDLSQQDSLDSSGSFTWLPTLNLAGLKIKILYKEMFNTPELEKINRLDIHDNQLKYLDKDTFEALPNLEILSLHANKLQRLHKSSFNGINSLAELFLFGNHFVHLDNDILKRLENLTLLDLSLNKLTTLDNNLFVKSKKIKWLWLDYNQITTLNKKIFRPLNNLTHLSLSNNKLSHFDKDTLNKLENLKSIDLSCNNLTQLNKEIFRGLKNLRRLNLANNRLIHLDKAIFNELENLEWLDLSGNQLKQLNTETFRRLKRLKKIYLSYNQLSPENIQNLKIALQNIYDCLTFEILPDKIVQNWLMPKLDNTALMNFAKTSKRMNKLAQPELINRYDQQLFEKMLAQRQIFIKKLSKNGTQLDLKYSKITVIYKEVFDSPEFENLISINLFGNQLKHLDNNMFKGLNNLKYLDLSFNKLEHIDKYTFRQLKKLKQLNLSFNKLTYIDKDIFKELNNLKVVYLQMGCYQLTPENAEELRKSLSNGYIYFQIE